MSVAEVLPDNPDGSDETTVAPDPLGLAPDVVEVRRNAGLAALVGALASAVGIAYLARATATGAALDWVLAAAMGLVGVFHLAALVDARTPLLVADTQGVRIRLGQSWRGLPWGALRQIEHAPRRGFLRDGRLVLVVRNPERLIEELDRRGRRQSRIARRMYGAPFAVPLAISTKVTGAGDDLGAALTRLSGDSVPVHEVIAAEPVDEPAAAVILVEPDEQEVVEEEHESTDRARRLLHPLPALAHAIGTLAHRLRGTPDVDDVDVEASETPSPLREPRVAARAEVRRALVLEDDDESGKELRRPGSVNLVEDTQVWGERVSPIARAGSAVEPLLIDDYAIEPAEDPVIGPELLAARTRLGLTVDQVADRTRIRPHVIESIEVDDFAPCGGDFYARGHLRTLARILGVEAAPLLTRYDDRYADAPINPRRVFEAELATGSHGSIRGTRGGPNWSVLIAAVMTLVLAWSVARLIMDSPVPIGSDTPILNGSGGFKTSSGKAAPAVPVVLEAAGGGAHVVVRDGTGAVVFNGNLAFGQSKTIPVSPPVRIQTSDGSVEVSVDGRSLGAMGTTGQPAQDTFVTE